MATEEEQQEQQRKQKGFFLQQWLADRVQQGNRELESRFSHVQQSQAGGKKTKNNNNKVSFVSLNTMGAALAGRGRRHNGGRQQKGGFASLSASGIEPKVKEEAQELKDNLVQKAERLEVKAEKMGEKMRVPVPETKFPLIGPVPSLVLKQLLCGIIAGGIAGTAIVPFEIVKTRVLAGQGGHTTAQVVNQVAHVEGAGSVMKGGVVIGIVRQALEKGVQFTTYELVKKREEKRHTKDPKVLPLPRRIPIATLAGAVAGVTSALVTYPFQSLGDRLILNAEAYKGLTDALVKVGRTEGWSEIFRGITPTLLRMAPSAAASFYTYETLKERYLRSKGKRDLDTWASLSIGAIAGAVASTLTYPLQVAQKEINMSAIPTEAVGMNYQNVFEALRGIVKKEGIGGLYRGLPIELVEIVPYTALSFAVYEAAKRVLLAVNEERRDQVKDGLDE
jgi:solute carrier family 25 phosphate transporter 23/24/25/41